MKYIGNFKDWIKQEWVKELTENQGIASPRDLWKREAIHEEDLVTDSKGHSIHNVTQYVFREEDVSFRDELTKTLPHVSRQGEVNWWFTKYLPGQYLPVHRDLGGQIGVDNSKVKRYWMPFTPYEVGHIYLYENTIIAPYQVGDLYEMPDPSAQHGAANLGETVRIILNVGVDLV
jgi:hypothetical protein